MNKVLHDNKVSIRHPGLADQQAFIEAKKKELIAKKNEEEVIAEEASADFPINAQVCVKCHTKAVVFTDGCMTCLNCGDSKCS